MADSYFEEIEEDESEYLARYEQRQRMRQERQRRRMRQRMLKRVLYLGGSVIVIGIIIAVRMTGGKQREEDMQSRQQAMKDAGQADDGSSWMSEEERTGSGGPPVTAAASGDVSAGAAGGSGETVKKAESDKPAYSFTATTDTVSIYSEEVISTHAILVDESTDTIVASKGADERIYPASMTKVLTVLVAAEQITEEDLDDTFTMTLEITDYAYVNDCSAVGFLDGEKVKVRDLFYGTILPSGGDAALGLATYIAGSQEAFVEMMNTRLEELGIGDSAHFTNCIGLHDEEHYCSVYDMAVIMKAAVQNELCREILSAHTYTTAPTVEHPEGITISNWFLRKIEDKDTGGEVICGKTGYVIESKNCAVSYGTFAGGTPYICVTAGSTSGWRCIYDHVEIYNRYVPAGG